MLDGQILIPRMFFRDRDGRLVRRHAIDFPVVEGVPREERVAAVEPVIDAHLREVLVGRLRVREEVLGGAAPERSAVRARKQRVEVRRHGGMQRHRPARQDALSRVVVGHRRHAGHPEPFDQRFECAEVERVVSGDRSAEHAAELMAIEIGDRFVHGIEEVLRVEGGVSVELEPRSTDRVRARPRHRVDHAAGRAPELRGVRVGQHLELEHRLDAEQHAGRRSGRLVVNVVDVGAVEQEAVLLGPGAVDRDLRRPAADHVAAGCERGRDAGLQERELLERSAVQRQLTDLLVADESAEGARRRVDRRRGAGHRQLLRDRPDLHPHVDDGVLSDGELNAAARDRLESGLRHVDFVFARLQHRHAVAPRGVGLQLPHGAGRDVDDDDVRVGERGAGGVDDDALQAGADGLRVTDQRDEGEREGGDGDANDRA